MVLVLFCAWKHMKLPNWAKIVWWIVLLVVLTTYLGERYTDL